MTEKNFILATAGHVDHGKSALVKALTGTDPDRLPEEKARGITIDLGFASLRLPAPLSTLNKGQSGSDQLSTFSVGIVDVPGHEDFVRNMIAGVGSIDFALLVVAAEDGWMPQTEEHLQILLYLGVKRIVVALTKSDLGNTESVTTQIREQLNDSPFANSQIIPTSTRTGEGIENLKRALSSELTDLLPPRDIGKPRLFVDRAFTLRGLGTVVTGTLTGGQIQRGQNVVIQPQNLSTRVRSIQSHGRDLETAHPGTRIGVNLPDLVVGSDLNRGDVIAAVGYEPTSRLDVLLTRSSRLPRSAAIKSGTSAYVHHGTRRMLAKIIFAETASLAAGESAVAQLRLGAPLLAFVGDRLIVRDASEQHTIAGGVVFNIDSTPNDFRSNHQRALLASRTVSPDDVDLAVWTEMTRSDVIETSHFLERSRFSEPELAAALQRLSEHGEIFLRDNVGAKMGVWRDLQKRAASVVDTAHRKHPERRGLELNQLRTELNSLSPAACDALIVDLCGDEFVRSGSTIARRSHRASLPQELKAAADKVCAALAAKPFDPPARGSIAAKNDAVFRFLIDNGELVEVAPEVVLLRESFEQMKAGVVEFISKDGPATASQLREALQSSRRVIIPFLEYLDRIGVTQRIGDSRQLRETKPAAVARQ